MAVEFSPNQEVCDVRVNGRQPKVWGAGGYIDAHELGCIVDDAKVLYQRRMTARAQARARKWEGR